MRVLCNIMKSFQLRAWLSDWLMLLPRVCQLVKLIALPSPALAPHATVGTQFQKQTGSQGTSRKAALEARTMDWKLHSVQYCLRNIFFLLMLCFHIWISGRAAASSYFSSRGFCSWAVEVAYPENPGCQFPGLWSWRSPFSPSLSVVPLCQSQLPATTWIILHSWQWFTIAIFFLGLEGNEGLRGGFYA